MFAREVVALMSILAEGVQQASRYLLVPIPLPLCAWSVEPLLVYYQEIVDNIWIFPEENISYHVLIGLRYNSMMFC